MNNMWAGEPGKGLFNIKFDFEKSHDSYIFDKNTNKDYLDFFSMFSSIPLGYNHPTFLSEPYLNEIKKVSQFKIVNCEFLTDEYVDFYNVFKQFVSYDNEFTDFHFCSTGALAVECAIKAAIYNLISCDRPVENPKVIAVKNNFHGIMSYGNIVTTRFFPVTTRLDGFPGDIWPKFKSTIELEHILDNDNSIAGVLVEPIQSTYGDIHLSKSYLSKIRDLCTKYNVPLIFDEIQTGFCATGKTWYFEHLDIIPDIVTFGKKSQIAGVMARKDFSDIFETKRLYTTWDGDLIDMIRCKYIIKTIEKNNLFFKIRENSNIFINELKNINKISNVRGIGTLIAFDFQTRKERDKFHSKLYKNGMLSNPTGKLSIRLRSNLNTSTFEYSKALELIKETVND